MLVNSKMIFYCDRNIRLQSDHILNLKLLSQMSIFDSPELYLVHTTLTKN